MLLEEGALYTGKDAGNYFNFIANVKAILLYLQFNAHVHNTLQGLDLAFRDRYQVSGKFHESYYIRGFQHWNVIFTGNPSEEVTIDEGNLHFAHFTSIPAGKFLQRKISLYPFFRQSALTADHAGR